LKEVSKIEERMRSTSEEAKKTEKIFQLQLQQVNSQSEDAKTKVPFPFPFSVSIFRETH
jgi:hypothetical protein